jgi:hypothetical protein
MIVNVLNWQFHRLYANRTNASLENIGLILAVIHGLSLLITWTSQQGTTYLLSIVKTVEERLAARHTAYILNETEISFTQGWLSNFAICCYLKHLEMNSLPAVWNLPSPIPRPFTNNNILKPCSRWLVVTKSNALRVFVCLSTLSTGSNPTLRKAAWSLYFCVVSYVGMGPLASKFYQAL